MIKFSKILQEQKDFLVESKRYLELQFFDKPCYYSAVPKGDFYLIPEIVSTPVDGEPQFSLYYVKEYECKVVGSVNMWVA